MTDSAEFAAYVPRMLLGADAPTSPRYWEAEGTLLFADISGFTRLAERLARQGKAGAEHLVTTLSDVFTSLLSASDDGGDLLKFGGDALLVFYEGTDHADRACHAAAAMRRVLDDVGRLNTQQGRVRLRMSQGAHSGVFPFFLVGDDHLELIVGGRPATTTVEMESAADASQILISPQTASRIDPRWLGERKGDGVLLGRVATPGSACVPDMPAAGGAPVERYIPALLRAHLGRDTAEHEHRQVTVAFVHFYGVDDIIEQQGAAEAFQRIQHLTLAVQAATSAYGVCIICTDIGPDGGKFMLTSGTPFAAEDHEARMLHACRQIVDSDSGLTVRAGVNRGHVFGGDVGAPFRRTYSTMGDAVNLAARIMGKAGAGQLLAHRSVIDRASARFETHPVPPFTVKGKMQPVEAALVGPPVRAEAPLQQQALPLIGREPEHAAFREALESARAGSGRVVELVGEAGIGKTRIAAAIAAEASDLLSATVVCDSYERTTAYVAADVLLRRLLGLDDVGPKATGQALMSLVERSAPELAPWLPLLATPLGASVPSTNEVDELAPRFRRARMHGAVAALVAALAQPTLVVVEDAHWMDDASAELLAHLFAGIADLPWLAVVARRPDEVGLQSSDGYTATELHLQPLADAAATQLAIAASTHAPLSEHRTRAVIARAGGNPLFLLELIASGADDHTGSLPESVEALLAARVDRLHADDRRALRCIAVLGLRFSRWLVDAALSTEGVASTDDDLWRRLGAFVGRDGDTFAFHHDLARTTAYEGLTFARRRALHGLVADALETTADARQIEPALLALHAHRAGRFDRSWRYSKTAAERARAASANTEAVELYEQALVAARHLPALPSAEITAVAETLGDVAEVAALYSRATHAYRDARAAARGDLVAQVRLARKEGTVHERRGRYTTALRAYGKALTVAEDLHDEQARTAQKAHLAVAYAGVRFRQGKLDEAIHWAREAAGYALAVEDLPTLANAYYLLNASFMDQGKDEEAAVFQDIALPIYEQLGDLLGQANVLNNLGVNAYYEGRWTESLALYERSRSARERAGDIVGAATAANNIGEILSDQGDLARARDLLTSALRTWRAADYPVGVALATSNLGRVAARAGRIDEAFALLSEAEQRFTDIKAEAFVLETRARQAEALIAAGRYVEAWEAASHVLEAAGESAQPVLVAMAHRLRGLALLHANGVERARECLQESAAVAREAGATYELALTLQVLADLDGDEARAREAAGMLTGLGVATAAEERAPQDTVEASVPQPGLAIGV